MKEKDVIGILIMPTENFWPEFSTGHVHISDSLFSRSVVRFSRLLDFIELKFDFRLRSASSRHVLSGFLEEELCTFRIRSARSSQVSKFVLVLSLLLSQSWPERMLHQ